MPVEREECCKNCGKDIPASVPRTSNFCSYFCKDVYEQNGEDTGRHLILDEIDENIERAMLGTATFAVLCIRCKKIVGGIPGLLEELGEGRPLDDLKRQHLNCPKKEATS